MKNLRVARQKENDGQILLKIGLLELKNSKEEEKIRVGVI